jgi:hypothetical protein
MLIAAIEPVSARTLPGVPFICTATSTIARQACGVRAAGSRSRLG